MGSSRRVRRHWRCACWKWLQSQRRDASTSDRNDGIESGRKDLSGRRKRRRDDHLRIAQRWKRRRPEQVEIDGLRVFDAYPNRKRIAVERNDGPRKDSPTQECAKADGRCVWLARGALGERIHPAFQRVHAAPVSEKPRVPTSDTAPGSARPVRTIEPPVILMGSAEA